MLRVNLLVSCVIIFIPISKAPENSAKRHSNALFFWLPGERNHVCL